jgi:hypothetical protein
LLDEVFTVALGVGLVMVACGLALITRAQVDRSDR